ncbi:MAG: hypothetical protein LBR33_00840 [Propionibacteriaceae bacterium]|jgi:hypothetical protein|nr:hypothetical protein [Propionibacteriaceae bacterium]
MATTTGNDPGTGYYLDGSDVKDMTPDQVLEALKLGRLDKILNGTDAETLAAADAERERSDYLKYLGPDGIMSAIRNGHLDSLLSGGVIA